MNYYVVNLRCCSFTAHKGCYYPLTDPYLDNLVIHKCKLASSCHLDYPYRYVCILTGSYWRIHIFEYVYIICMGFPGGSDGKDSTCNARDPGSIPGLGRSPGGGHDDSLQNSYKNPTGRETWRATVHGVTKSWTQLSN